MEAEKEKKEVAVVLLCRVSMGHHFQVPSDQTFERDARRQLRKCTCPNDKCKCREYYDSVVAQTNVRDGTTRHRLHREIVVYDPDVVYPEFMLIFSPPSAGRSSSAQRALSAQATLTQLAHTSNVSTRAHTPRV